MKCQDCMDGRHGRCDRDVLVQTEDPKTGIVYCERDKCVCWCNITPIPDPDPGEKLYDPNG